MRKGKYSQWFKKQWKSSRTPNGWGGKDTLGLRRRVKYILQWLRRKESTHNGWGDEERAPIGPAEGESAPIGRAEGERASIGRAEGESAPNDSGESESILSGFRDSKSFSVLPIVDEER